MTRVRARGGARPGPFGIATIAVSVLFLGAAVFAPGSAGALLRLYLLTLALGFVVARGYAAFLPARMTQDFYSPFDGSDPRSGPPAAPEALLRITAELEAVDSPRAAERTAIPRAVRWRVIDEAARRLVDRHGLDLSDPADHDAIRRLVSAEAWKLIEPAQRTVPSLSRLSSILDEVETL